VTINIHSLDTRSKEVTSCHILRKASESLPVVAHFDPTSTIVFEALVVWVLAPLKHLVPTPVHRMPLSVSWGHTMFRIAVLHTLLAYGL
jgi:hypothetical protein